MLRRVFKISFSIILFVLVWGLFPGQWLIEKGMDAVWVGLLKMCSAILVAWAVIVFRTDPTKKQG